MSLFSYKSSSTTSAKTDPFKSASSTNSAQPDSASTNTSQPRINQFDYVPKRYGLHFDPPTIVLEYLVPSSGKLYHHKMKLLNMKESSDTQEVIDQLKKKHALYFSSNKVSEKQLTNLIDRLKMRLPKNQDTENIQKDNFAATKQNFFPKSNAASTPEPKKQPLGKLTSLNSNAPDSRSTLTDSNQNTKKSSSSNDFWASKKEEKDTNGFWDLDDDEDIEKTDYQTANLNKLSNEELKKHKDKMDVLFQKNRKKPGDPGFVYDVQEDFRPTQDNEWDEDF